MTFGARRRLVKKHPFVTRCFYPRLHLLVLHVFSVRAGPKISTGVVTLVTIDVVSVHPWWSFVYPSVHPGEFSVNGGLGVTKRINTPSELIQEVEVVRINNYESTI